MPSVREALRGEMDYWSDIRPSDRVLYHDPTDRRSLRDRLLLGGAVVAGIGVGGALALRGGYLRPLFERAFERLGRAEFRRAYWLQARFRAAASALEDRTLRRWSRPFEAIRRFANAPPNFQASRRPPAMVERLLAEREEAIKAASEWRLREAGSIDEALTNRIRNLIDQDLMRNRLIWDREAEEQLLRATGYRHAKIGELLERGYLRRTAVMDEMRDLYPDFLERMADPLILINERGQIADFRLLNEAFRNTLKSLERDFGLPFVGFNPLQLFYGSQILGLDRLPRYHFINPRSIQPLLTGNIQPLNKPVLFIGGRALEITAGGFEEIARGRLVPARHGTTARIIRSLSGIRAAEFGRPDPTWPWYKKVGYKVGDILHLGRQDVPPTMLSLGEAEGDILAPDKLLGSGIYWFFRKTGINPPTVYKSLEASFGPTEYIFMRSYKSLEEAGSVGAYFRQFWASRSNLQNMTYPSLIPYHFFARLNEGLNRAGLGLPVEDLGSPASIFGNLLLRRAFPVVGGIFAWQYLNWEFENLFGFQPEDILADMYIGAQVDIAALRDRLGITEWFKHFQHVLPGFEELQALPFIGPLLELDRSAEETLEYYTEGVEPIRAGRYWPFGNTPFIGGRVDRFVPTWTRQIKTDPWFTENWLGEPEEYFSHAPFPTPRYPFAPLTRYVFDPYRRELETYYDRPYPLTGGLPEIEEFPLIGPLLQSTIGELIKPTRRMHPEFWEAYERGESYGEATPLIFGQAAAGAASLPEVVAANSLPQGVPAFGTLPPGVLPGAFSPGLDGGLVEVPGVGEVPGAYVAYVTPSGQIQPMVVSPGLTEEVLKARLQTMSGLKAGLLPMPVEEPETMGALPGEGYGTFGELYYNITEMAGFYGFTLESITGAKNEEPRIARASAIASPTRAFWGFEFGGIPGDISEIGRRFIPRRKFDRDYNPIPNTQPSWLPGDESRYFLNFRRGDPYVLIKQGELRLPGAAYEAVWNLPEVEQLMSIPEIARMVETGELNRFELYSPITRLRILADVAPWSDEYKRLSALISEMPLSEEEREEVKKIREMARMRKEPLRLYPYRFRTANLKYETVTIERVIDANNILVREYPGHPIRLAGIYVPTGQDDPVAQEAREYLSQFLYPGRSITIGYDADPLNKFAADTYQTIRAVIYLGSVNLNRELLERGLAREREEDFSPAAIHARFSPAEIAIGSAWEWFAHRDTPLNTKFLQVRSPLESYKRRDLYGKDFQRWENPWEDFILPTFQSWITRDPLSATLTGVFAGSLFGRTGYGRVIGAVVGGLLVGAGAVWRAAREAITGETWIPERRRLEWEVNEYLDIIKYIRALRNFNQLAQRALEEEGVDVRRLIEEQRRLGEERKARIRELEELKRAIVTSPQELTPEQISRMLRAAGIDTEVQNVRAAVRAINAAIKTEGARQVIPIGPITARALQAYQEISYTMYGYSGGSLAGAISALPKNVRKYFSGFLNAPEEEREEIRELAPPYMRRILDYLWGEGLAPQVPLEEFFQTRALPGPEWAGWDPNVPWEAVRVRIIQATGLDEDDMDIWDDDRRLAEAYPIPVPKLELDFRQSAQEIRQRLIDILGASGYRDYIVNVEPGGYGIETRVEILHDRRREAQALIENVLPDLLMEGI